MADVADATLRPFMGRAAERRVLDELLDVAGAGRAAVVLVTGEAGIGKTRLVEEATVCVPPPACAEVVGPGRMRSGRA